MRVSRIIQPAMPPTSAGSGGSLLASSGVSDRDRMRAKARRTRGGTAVSPMPGISMRIEPTRAKTRPAAQTWAGAAHCPQPATSQLRDAGERSGA